VLVHDEVERIARWATEDLRPDLTVLLDVDPHRAVGEKAELDRLEAAGADFHLSARAYFLALAARDPDTYLVLDARDDRDGIAAAVRDRVQALLPGPPPTDCADAPT
jgi:dTMP kinase